MRQNQFKKLFEPGNIGRMQVKNRIVMPPMGTAFCSDSGYVNQRLLDYHEARAKGGAGLLITEITAPCFQGKINKSQLTIADDIYIPGLKKLADTIHRYGAKAAVQLHHAGREIQQAKAGYPPVSPSPTPTFSGEIPHELTTDEISEIVSQFAAGARRAKEAGFDGVELHGAHQYLICSFLSGATNLRKDRYGGSLENRARFLVEILQAIRKQVGADYPVWVRLSAQEWGMENGITIEETKQVVPILVDAGAQAIHVSGYGIASYITRAPSPDVPGFLLPLAEEVKKVTRVPVIAVGRLDAELAERTLEEGKADFIAFGRRILADPELVNKIASNRLDEVNPCIGCMECLERMIYVNEGARCAVNPAMGREREYQIRPATKVKKVVVIGGGPAGMEAARVAALRGHRITLLEKGPKLGGQLNVAAVPPNKSDINAQTSYRADQVQKAGIEIKLNTEANPERVLALKPDAVVIATGGIPIIPDIQGVAGTNVVTATNALAGKTGIGQNVVVIGGGMVGCETAHFLAEQGKKVAIIEILKRMANDMMPMVRRRLMDGLRANKVAMLNNAKCESITDGKVTVITADGKRQELTADTIILAVGYKANNELFKALKGKVPEIYNIGDSAQPRRIMDAYDDGCRTGLSL